jgi:peptidyl-prolyl cis-trans isomerase C
VRDTLLRVNLSFIISLWLIIFGTPVVAQNIVEDQGVGISREELEFLVKLWTPDMQQAAANDKGDRIELINQTLASKKIAAQADAIDRSSDPDAYWRYVMSVRNTKAQFVSKQYIAHLEVPDFTALAEERYKTQKKKYALVAEERFVSHILLLCGPPACVREERRPEAEDLLRQLQEGANFEELATEHSEDPGSKAKGGSFDKWFRLGEPGVEAHFTGGAYEIENVGDYSGVVETRFGFHIIRLDGLRDEHYKPYEEVKDAIAADLRREYIDLSAKDFNAGFRLTDEAVIDEAVLEDIFAPYKAQ